jgi:hypothetical protein
VVRQSFAFWERGDRNPEDLDFAYTTDRNGSDIHIGFTGRITECRGQRSEGTFAFCSADGDRSRLLVAGVYRTGSMEAILRTVAGQYAGHEEPARFEGVPDLSSERLRFVDPWPTEETVTVNLSVRSGEDRDWEPLVRAGIDYWQGEGSQHATYSQEMVFDPDAADADITVTVVEEIPECGIHEGTETRALGCAGRYNTSVLAGETVPVQIETGWDDRTTVQTVKHEFGHVYGLTHDDEPTSIMNATYSEAATAPETNVSDRINPFGPGPVDVFVDTDSFSAPASAVRAQVRHAVEYYDAGADGAVDPSVDVRLHDDRETADVVVESGDLSVCSSAGDVGSCGILSRRNTDFDPAWEYYERQNVTLSGVETETIGWHTGYWLGFSVAAAETESELPAPFRETDPEHKRDWWK